MSNYEQKNHAVNKDSEAPFQGVQLHCMGYFPVNFLERREKYEKTLDLFEISPKFSDNTSILNRPTHVFRSSPDIFEQLRRKALEDKELIHVEVIENWSELGFPCYLYAKHKSGEEIFYDGIIFRITSNITDEEFQLQDATLLMGYPPHAKSINSLNAILRNINNDFPLFGYRYRHFYTALKTEWNLLNIEAHGDPSIQLSLIDPNFVRITALEYVEYGGKYCFYIGDYQKTLQLIAYDLYHSNEIENWQKYILQKTDGSEDCLKQASDAFTTLSKSFWRLRHKLSAYNKVKRGFIYLLQELPLLYRYELLLKAYKEIAEKNLSGINGRRQIFISSDDWDNRSAISHYAKYFFRAEIKDNQIINISEEPISPNYTHEINALESSIEVFKKTVDKSFNLTKDLCASAQTEFSAYSIWFAIITIIITSTLSSIPFFTSSYQGLKNKEENKIPRLNIDSYSSKKLSSSIWSNTDKTVLLFETSENVVRIFTRNNQTLLNLYDKQSKVTRMNSIPVDVEYVYEGARYTNLEYKIVVEVFKTPILFINNKINR